MNKEKTIAERLVKYFEEEGRDLPWRHQRNPYRIWISEIMLQQTRVEAVKNYYARFIRELPNIEALAHVEDDFLMTLWEGLGYYSRARNLKKSAVLVCDNLNGVMPKTAKELEELPGIGKYTAAAIASFCYGEKIAALDGNGLRVFARLYGIQDDILSKKGENKVREVMQACVEYASSASFNQAVMDLASAICIPKGAAKCELCPLQDVCWAFENKQTDTLPVRNNKTKKVEEPYSVLVFRYENEVCLEKRQATGLLAGLYGFPMISGHLSKQEIYELFHTICDKDGGIEELGIFTHIFSHKIWKMNVFMVQCNQKINNYEWARLNDIAGKYAIPSAFSGILRIILEKTGGVKNGKGKTN